MHRRYPDTPLFRKVLQSIWHQVNNGQDIFLVGKIQPDDTVVGGTGVSAEYAKFFNKRLHVFDQEQDGWFRWTGDAWEAVEGSRDHAPALHRHRHPLPARQRPRGDRGPLRPHVRPGEALRRTRGLLLHQLGDDGDETVTDEGAVLEALRQGGDRHLDRLADEGCGVDGIEVEPEGTRGDAARVEPRTGVGVMRPTVHWVA